MHSVGLYLHVALLPVSGSVIRCFVPTTAVTLAMLRLLTVPVSESCVAKFKTNATAHTFAALKSAGEVGRRLGPRCMQRQPQLSAALRCCSCLLPPVNLNDEACMLVTDPVHQSEMRQLARCA